MNPLTPRELIDAMKALPAKGLLRDLGFTLTSRDTRFYPCPACNAAPAETDRHKRGVAQVVNNAAFYCYRCCTGGSTLDILLLRHGLDPKRMDDAAYRCMRDYLGEASQSLPERLQTPPAPEKPPLFTHRQVQRWYGGMWRGIDCIRYWLDITRGLGEVDDLIKGNNIYGAIESIRQLPIERPDLREAAAHGHCAAFPLYSLASGDICNVVIRPLTPFLPPGQSKPWKARTLNAGAGTTRDGGFPLVYGNPHAVPNPSMIVIVEGALDQLTALAMSPPDVLVLGAFCADDIPLLASWCLQQTAPIVLVPHIDKPTDRYPRGIGWGKMEALAELTGARLIEWHSMLLPFGLNLQMFRESGRSDINDLVRRDMGDPITTIERLTPIWHQLLEDI